MVACACTLYIPDARYQIELGIIEAMTNIPLDRLYYSTQISHFHTQDFIMIVCIDIECPYTSYGKSTFCMYMYIVHTCINIGKKHNIKKDKFLIIMR